MTNPSFPLRLLAATFDFRIQVPELVAFRGAIARAVGADAHLFHNHNNEAGGYMYRYPLIQYKIYNRSPMLMCLGEAVDDVHRLFERPEPVKMEIASGVYALRLANLRLEESVLTLHEEPMIRYKILDWMPLTQDNKEQLNAGLSLVERYQLLENKLRNVVVGMAHGVGWKDVGAVKVKLIEISAPRTGMLKGVKVMLHDATFECNLEMPEGLGLGKGAAMGLGIVVKAGGAKLR